MNLNPHVNHRLLFGIILAGFVFLTCVIAVNPALWVQEHTDPLPGSRPLSAEEERGLAVYVAEGCPYCHTQQVRPLALDRPYGRPSAPGDYARLRPQDFWRMTPGLLGTERTGPDLSNLAARQPSDTWNYVHLYNPRAVVGDSVMQAYPWLFGVNREPSANDVVVPVPPKFAPPEGKVTATADAKALVAYLISLKQAPVPGYAESGGVAAPGPQAAASAAGKGIYGTHCASCHGQNGEGVPGVFPPMKGDPVVIAADPARHIAIVIFGLQGEAIGGVNYGAAMPEHGDELTDAEIAAVVNHERTSWGNSAPTATPADVARVRKEGKR
ncbi:MAG TPA: cbb3-type cytochrome c oxidase subunit II [Geobacteraceae bacterium]|nr:cbb3-type cytochrome c oxidase subunit II [Geobacteraceae bacterium]